MNHHDDNVDFPGVAYTCLVTLLDQYKRKLGTGDENRQYEEFKTTFSNYSDEQRKLVINYIPLEDSEATKSVSEIFCDVDPLAKNLFCIAISENMPKIVELFLEISPEFVNEEPKSSWDIFYQVVISTVGSMEEGGTDHDAMLMLLLKYDVDVETGMDYGYPAIQEYINYFIGDGCGNMEIMIMMLNKLGFKLGQNCNEDVLYKAIASYMVKYHLESIEQGDDIYGIKILTQETYEPIGSHCCDSVYKKAREMLNSSNFDNILGDIDESSRNIIEKEFQKIQSRVPFFFFKIDSFAERLKIEIDNYLPKRDMDDLNSNQLSPMQSGPPTPYTPPSPDTPDTPGMEEEIYQNVEYGEDCQLYDNDNDKYNAEWLAEGDDELCSEGLRGKIQKIVRRLLRESLNYTIADYFKMLGFNDGEAEEVLGAQGQEMDLEEGQEMDVDSPSPSPTPNNDYGLFLLPASPSRGNK